jgi:hypothetical protein
LLPFLRAFESATTTRSRDLSINTISLSMLQHHLQNFEQLFISI